MDDIAMAIEKIPEKTEKLDIEMGDLNEDFEEDQPGKSRSLLPLFSICNYYLLLDVKVY